jgi:hypothetical protein
MEISLIAASHLDCAALVDARGEHMIAPLDISQSSLLADSYVVDVIIVIY